MLQRGSLLARGARVARASRGVATVTASAEASYTAKGIAGPRAGFHFLHIDDFSKDQLGRACALGPGRRPGPADSDRGTPGCLAERAGCRWRPRMAGGGGAATGGDGSGRWRATAAREGSPETRPAASAPAAAAVAMLDTAIEVKARLKSGDNSFKPFAGACVWRWGPLLLKPTGSRQLHASCEGLVRPPRAAQLTCTAVCAGERRQEPCHDLHQAIHAHPRVV